MVSSSIIVLETASCTMTLNFTMSLVLSNNITINEILYNPMLEKRHHLSLAIPGIPCKQARVAYWKTIRPYRIVHKPLRLRFLR